MGRKGKVLSLAFLTMFSLSAVAVSTVAWFALGTHITFGSSGQANVIGGSDADYYESGTGTAGDPYILSNRIHVYNLAWLQYIGYYNQRSNVEQGAQTDQYQCYFKLKNDIDMEGLTIPPIGTNKYPFLGHFDGSDSNGNTCKISNFTISNDNPAQANSDFGVAKPGNLYGGTQPDVVGFFGVVGKLPNQSLSYDSTIVSVSNLLLEDFTVVSKTSQVLIGLAGGYVNGDMSGVKVGDNAKIDVNGQVSTAKADITSNLSDYGLVGYSTKMYNGNGDYSQGLSKLYANYDTSAAGGEGEGDDWGGSIDFKAFNQRIHDIFNTKTATYGSTYYGYYQTDEMKISFGRGGGSAETYLKQDQNTIQTYYLLQGDGDHYKSNSSSSTKLNMPGTVMPLLANDDFSTNEKNTGYIIGDTRPNSSGRLLFDSSIRSSSYTISHIGNSLSDVQITESEAYNGSGNGANVRYSENSVEILTNSAASYSQNNFVLVKDTYNTNHTVSNSSLTGYTKNDNTTPEKLALEKYSAARESLGTILDGSTLVHGLHFMDKDIAYNNTTSLTTAKLNGQTYNNYAFPKSCIDFHLKEDGKINFFGGSYYNASSGSRADCFFSLSVIERNGNSLTSSSIKKISYIYKNTAYDKTNPDSQKYIYRYSDNSYSDSQSNVGALVFDMRYLSETPPVQNAIYYFEIPVNKGEYALHGVSGHDAGGYLMYLDIGASADIKDKVDAHYITTTTSGVPHPIGVDFNVNGCGNNGGDSFGFAIASSNRGTVLVDLSSTSQTNDTVTVTQSSTIAVYSYRKTGYSSSFTISGISGDPPSGASNSIRVLTINLKTTDDDVYNIVITENLTTSESVYAINGETSNSYDDTYIENLSGEISDVDDFRDLPVVATLTRASGTAEFTTEYNISKCNDTKVDATITLNGTTITAAVTENYTFVANNETIDDGDTIR